MIQELINLVMGKQNTFEVFQKHFYNSCFDLIGCKCIRVTQQSNKYNFLLFTRKNSEKLFIEQLFFSLKLLIGDPTIVFVWFNDVKQRAEKLKYFYAHINLIYQYDLILILYIVEQYQMEVSLEVLNNILTQINLSKSDKIHLKKKKTYFFIKKYEIISQKNILKQAEAINSKKNNMGFDVDMRENWIWGEYKLFIWIAHYYLKHQVLKVSQIVKQQIDLMKALFPNKDEIFLSYEYTLAFFQENLSRPKWSLEQLQLFEKIIEKKGNQGKWKQISYQLFKQSNRKYFKTPYDCLNRWTNHNNPTINKKQWTSEEDLQFIRYLIKHGKRWAKISKSMKSGRNHHMVKNRYRCMIRKYNINQKSHSIEKISFELLRKIKAESSQIKQEQMVLSTASHQQIRQKLQVIDQQEEGSLGIFDEMPNQMEDNTQNQNLLSIHEIMELINKRESNGIFQQPKLISDEELEAFVLRQSFEEEVDIDCF